MTHDDHSDEAVNLNAEDFPEEAADESEAEYADPVRPGRKPLEPASPRPVARDAVRQAAPAARPQPSFVLSASGEQLTREEMLARSRRQRALPDDPFENGGRPKPPPGYRDRIMNEPRPVRFVERGRAAETAAPVRTQKTFTLGQTFAIASAMALVAGAGAGVVSAKFAAAPAASPGVAVAGAAQPQPVQGASAQLSVASAGTTQAGAANDTVIDKKPIATATLQVADVSGQTNSFIPLALHAEPGGIGKDILLKISGVPEGAYLTSGHRGDDQIWSLSLAETRDVKLVVPQAKTPEIDLAVAAFEPKTGELAAPVKTMTVELKDVVVEPVSAPPPGQEPASTSVAAKSALPGAEQATLPATITPPAGTQVALATPETPETQQLINSANMLLVSGDVAAARKSFERAWGNDGSAAAAFGLARSYDPVVLATLTRGNATPDRDQALQWYQRAAKGGNPDAAEAVARLQMKP